MIPCTNVAASSSAMCDVPRLSDRFYQPLIYSCLMRTIVTSACSALCGLLFLSSCGGSSATHVKENDLLGKVPGIYVNLALQKKQLGEKLNNAGKDVDKRKAILDDYAAFSAECAQAATEAGQEAIGRDIPVSGADIYPDFEITRVQVADFKAGGESGSFTVRIMAKAKRDLPLCKLGYKPGEGEYSLQETRFYYALIRSDDHLIELGQVNPFSSKPYMGQPAAEYESGQTIPAGSLCNSQGAPIAINCHTYDFTDFAKIVFLPEKDYQSMRRQAYGF